MAKSNSMKDLLKQRMSAAQQVSEMEIGNRAYESLIDPLPAAASTIRELPVDKLRPFFTTDIGFHPYPPEKLRAFAQQLLEQGLLERIIVRSIPGSDEYEILISVRNQLDDDGYPTGDLTVTLIPQVVNKDGDKTDVALFNSRADRTFIELEKYVSGDNADLGEYFKFRIDFTNATEGDVFTISGQDSTVMYHGDTIVTQSSFVVGQENYVYLKDGQKIELGIDADDYSELPIGLSYSITEIDASDYDTYIDGATENNKTSTAKTTESRSGGQMMLMSANSINQNFTSFENVKNTSVATGVNSVILPFVIIALLGVVSFAIYFAISKRKQ